MTQIANNSNIALVDSVKTFDGHGASVQPMSHELVGVKLTINRREKSEENNYWFGLRVVCAVGFCANQHDHDRGNDNKHKASDDK